MTKAARKAERMELRRSVGQRKPRVVAGSSVAVRSPYHLAHVCFRCRRSTKLTPSPNGKRRCSRCAAPLFEMGRSFRAPAADDVEQWTKIQALYALGFRFVGSRRHRGPPLPARLREVAKFANEHAEHPLRIAPVIPELVPAELRKQLKRA